jgi:hypothetical protein
MFFIYLLMLLKKHTRNTNYLNNTCFSHVKGHISTLYISWKKFFPLLKCQKARASMKFATRVFFLDTTRFLLLRCYFAEVHFSFLLFLYISCVARWVSPSRLKSPRRNFSSDIFFLKGKASVKVKPSGPRLVYLPFSFFNGKNHLE